MSDIFDDLDDFDDDCDDGFQDDGFGENGPFDQTDDVDDPISQTENDGGGLGWQEVAFIGAISEQIANEKRWRRKERRKSRDKS